MSANRKYIVWYLGVRAAHNALGNGAFQAPISRCGIQRSGTTTRFAVLHWIIFPIQRHATQQFRPASLPGVD